MSPQDAAERKRQERARKREAGLEKVELWLTRAEKKWILAALAKRRTAK